MSLTGLLGTANSLYGRIEFDAPPSVITLSNASNTLVFTQTALGGILHQYVTQTLTFTQVVTTNTIDHFVGVLGAWNSQLGWFELGLPPPAAHSASNTLVFTQSATYVKKGVQLASNTLTFTQNASVLLYKNATNTLVFTQSATVNVNSLHNAANTLVFTQTATGITLNQTVIQNLVFTQSPTAQRVITANATNFLVLRQKLQKVIQANATNALTFTEDVTQPLERTGYNTLVFTQTLTLQKILNRNIEQELIFTETASRTMAYVRTASNTLIFNPFYLKDTPIPGLQIPIYPAQYSIKRAALPITFEVYNPSPSLSGPIPFARVNKTLNIGGTVVLQTDDSVIVLPTPDFGDTQNNSDELINRRSMTGVLYTYVRSTPFRKLHYTFKLGRPKSLELRRFVLLNSAKPIQLTNWKDEIWVVKLLTNPVKLDPKSRWDNCDNERVDTTLEFEGVRIF